MVSRCPSCGSPTQEDENQCPSCGWDFVARKRVTKTEAPASVSPPLPPPPPPPPPPTPVPPPPPAPEPQETSLPQAGNLNVPPVSAEPLYENPPPSEHAEPEPLQPESTSPPPARESTPPVPSRPAAGSRSSLVLIAAIAGCALGTVSVLAVYLLMRPDTAPGSRPAVAASPFGHASAPPAATSVAPSVDTPPAAALPDSPAPLLEAPPPASAPAPNASRPSASFAATPHLIVHGQETKPEAKPSPADSEPAGLQDANGPKWTFAGTVFDLLTARGVFGAKLVFSNREGDVVGRTDSGPAGRYKITVPAGTGYKLRISHGDYTGRYIDEDGATNSLREAPLDERRILMTATARNLPWRGDPKKTVRRNLGLVPRSPEEP